MAHLRVFPFLLPSAPFGCHAPISFFPSLWQARLSLKQWKKIASLLYFFYFSVVCFIKAFNKRQCFTLVQILSIISLTNKIELITSSLRHNIDLFNAAICGIACSSAFFVFRISFLSKWEGRGSVTIIKSPVLYGNSR